MRSKAAKGWLIAAVCVLSVILVAGVAFIMFMQIRQQTAPETTAEQTTTEFVTTVVETVEETTEEITEPPTTAPVVVEINMSFVGDCTFGRNQNQTYAGSFDEKYDQMGVDYFLANVRPIFEQDDVTVINLEGSLTTSTEIQEGKQWCHKGRPEYVNIMTASSVEIATMGNNHRLDYGIKGFEETVQVLEEAGIGYCYENKVYLVYEVKGVKVGVVSVNEYYKGTTVEKWLKKGYEYLREEQGCQIVIAAPHWGGDKVSEVESYQRELGHKIIDMGYDLVVGSHPHVLQGMEIYNGRLICYSMGNFCYGGNKNPADRDSGILQYKFTLVDGELLKDVDAKFVPVHWCDPTAKYNDFQPKLAEGEEFTRILNKVSGYSQEFGLMLDETGRPIQAET